MSAIVGSVQVERSPDDVFGVAADPMRRAEWQESVSGVTVEPSAVAFAAGARIRETRRVTGGARQLHWELSEYAPPEAWGFRGLDGPVRPVGRMTFTPSEGGGATRVDMMIDFEGHGPFGRLLAAVARRDARRQVPLDLAGLKRVVEATGARA
jgi:uncharacterized protein YndB with AHSA1/START domain